MPRKTFRRPVDKQLRTWEAVAAEWNRRSGERIGAKRAYQIACKAEEKIVRAIRNIHAELEPKGRAA